MIGKRLYAVWPFLFVSGCGASDPPPPDAVVTAVEADMATTYTLVTVPTLVVNGAIHFKVQRPPPAGATTGATPLVGVKVELSGSSPTVGDTGAGFVGASSGGSFLNPADPGHMETTTNGSGVVAVFYQFTVPRCSTAADLVVTALISASVGVSTATWTNNITVVKDPTC